MPSLLVTLWLAQAGTESAADDSGVVGIVGFVLVGVIVTILVARSANKRRR